MSSGKVACWTIHGQTNSRSVKLLPGQLVH